jgi:MFS family permease
VPSAPPFPRLSDAAYARIQWTLAGHRLAFTAGMIVGGRLGDILGRKRMFIFAFVVASPLCGPAPTARLLILFRVIQGLAAAATFPQVLAIMHVPFPEEKRAAVFGAFGPLTGLAGGAGPLLVGANVSGRGRRTILPGGVTRRRARPVSR